MTFVDSQAAALGDLIGECDDGFDWVEYAESLRPLVARLPDRERLALRIFGNQTQSRIAEQVGCSQMQVSRLLETMLAGMRHALVSDGPSSTGIGGHGC